jgi:solute carrier family 25 S-adenosylmethionine transporter 26
MPLFMVASAAESKPSSSSSSNVPNWRLVAANLAAGATAGCAVEAGEQTGLGKY